MGEVNLPELARREAAAQSAAGDLSARLNSLENGLAGAHARVAAGAAAADAAIQALKQKQGNADARLSAIQQAWGERIDGVAQELTARISSTAAAQEEAATRALATLAYAGLAAAALLAALLGASVWLEGRGRRTLQRDISRALARQGAEFRQVLEALPPARDNSVSMPDWNSLEARLRHLVERGDNSAAPAPRRPVAVSPTSEKTTVLAGSLTEPAVASRLLWPADFFDPESPLSRWRFLLEGHLADDRHPALSVLTHLLGLRALLRPPVTATPTEIASALFRLSESLHAYWHSLTDLSAEDRQQASAAWLQGMRALMAGADARLDLREVRPGARVDPDLMHAVLEGPGNHLNVADVFSWAVLDRAGDRFRVLHRAQIAST